MKVAVNKNYLALKYAHENVLANKEVIQIAYSQNINALKFASDYLKKDLLFMLSFISKTGSSL
jgi:hypothetical protein